MTTPLDHRLALPPNTLPAELRHPAHLALRQLSLTAQLLVGSKP